MAKRWSIPCQFYVHRDTDNPQFVDVEAASGEEALALARSVKLIAPEVEPGGGSLEATVYRAFPPQYRAIGIPVLATEGTAE